LIRLSEGKNAVSKGKKKGVFTGDELVGPEEITFDFFCKKDHFNKLETCKFQAHFFLKLQPAFHKQKASAHAANFTCCTTAVTQSPSPSPPSLMLQKSGENSSVEVGSEYPIIYRV